MSSACEPVSMTIFCAPERALPVPAPAPFIPGMRISTCASDPWKCCSSAASSWLRCRVRFAMPRLSLIASDVGYRSAQCFNIVDQQNVQRLVVGIIWLRLFDGQPPLHGAHLQISTIAVCYRFHFRIKCNWWCLHVTIVPVLFIR